MDGGDVPNSSGGSRELPHSRAIVSVTGERFGVHDQRDRHNDGTLLFNVIEGYGNETTFMNFCDKLIEHHPGRKVFLIVDNAHPHKSIAVAAWQEDHPEMEIFYLPPYTPALNPTSI
jgi:hypothetical protein